ncbi:MAG: thioesterase family protein [Candidatus Omnitrophota bacterium]|jgi:acyl-CoA thioester hydrolase
MKVRIYYHDTDCGGVVYYANYLKYLEQGRTEFLEDKGISIGELSGDGVLFVVARQEIDYKAPAYYADTLEVITRLEDISHVKMVLSSQIKNQDGKTICLARTILVCVGKDLKPMALPQDVRKALE